GRRTAAPESIFAQAPSASAALCRGQSRRLDADAGQSAKSGPAFLSRRLGDPFPASFSRTATPSQAKKEAHVAQSGGSEADVAAPCAADDQGRSRSAGGAAQTATARRSRHAAPRRRRTVRLFEAAISSAQDRAPASPRPAVEQVAQSGPEGPPPCAQVG